MTKTLFNNWQIRKEKKSPVLPESWSLLIYFFFKLFFFLLAIDIRSFLKQPLCYTQGDFTSFMDFYVEAMQPFCEAIKWLDLIFLRYTSAQNHHKKTLLFGQLLYLQIQRLNSNKKKKREKSIFFPFQDSDEFAVENEDIFMQINSLTLGEDDPSEDASKDQEVVITNVGLPSAKTLRGGTTIVAKGRHGLKANESSAPHSAISSYSNSR